MSEEEKETPKRELCLRRKNLISTGMGMERQVLQQRSEEFAVCIGEKCPAFLADEAMQTLVKLDVIQGSLASRCAFNLKLALEIALLVKKQL